MKRLRLFALITSTGAITGHTALAHPHVFAEARLEVMVGSDGIVTGLRNVWRFDEAFSSSVVLDFDKNGNLKLDPEELVELGKTIHKSLADYQYFQMVRSGGKDVAIKPPPELMANMEDGQLIVLFEAGTAKPLKMAGKIDFGVYDPTFYTAIDFTRDDYLTVDGLPPGCSHRVVRPDPQEALKENRKSLTEAFFNDPAGNNLSKIFATRLEVTCGEKQ